MEPTMLQMNPNVNEAFGKKRKSKKKTLRLKKKNKISVIIDKLTDIFFFFKIR